MGEKAKFLLPKGFDTPMAAPVQAPAEQQQRAMDEYRELMNGRMPDENDDDFLGNSRDPDHDD